MLKYIMSSLLWLFSSGLSRTGGGGILTTEEKLSPGLLLLLLLLLLLFPAGGYGSTVGSGDGGNVAVVDRAADGGHLLARHLLLQPLVVHARRRVAVTCDVDMATKVMTVVARSALH